jgi:uncharacterized protein YggE
MKASSLILLYAALFLFMPVARAADGGISVTATGTVRAMPDSAVFDVVVGVSDRDAAKAASKSAERVALLQQALRVSGIPPADVVTAGYSVTPERVWDSGRNELRGYVAQHVVRVTVRELRKAGAAIDAAVGSRAGEVGPVRFVVSRYELLRRDALGLAVRNAKTDAEVMARAAGGRLGTLLELGTERSERPVDDAVFMKAAPAAAATDIAPGEQEVVVTVHSRWRFAQPSSR